MDCLTKLHFFQQELVIKWLGVVGFGSCHSLGVAMGLRGYGMCQMRGASRSRIFLKMRRVGCIIFSFSYVLIFSCPSCLRSRSLVPVGNLC